MGVAEVRGNRVVVKDDDRVREVLTYSRGRKETIQIPGFAQSSKWGSYMSGVGEFLATNDPAMLEPFVGDGITDIRGRSHLFETRPNVLYRISQTSTESLEQLLYKIVI